MYTLIPFLVRTEEPLMGGVSDQVAAITIYQYSGVIYAPTFTPKSAITFPASLNTGTLNNVYVLNGRTFDGILHLRGASGTGDLFLNYNQGQNVRFFGGGVSDLIGLTGSGITFKNNLLLGLGAPTISSGFGTGPSITTNNGPASFTINVGTGGTASSGVIGLPTAANGWNCWCSDLTTQSSTVFLCKQTASTTTTATITNYDTSGSAAAWAASDILNVSCFAR
jgi:hypothetical protein